MHLRKGDVGTVHFRDRYFCYGKFYDDPTMAPHLHAEVAEYDRVIGDLQSQFTHRSISVVVFSNGFAGTLRHLARLRPSVDELAAIDAQRTEFENDFLGLQRYPMVRTFLGEDEDSLFAAVHSFATADALVFNTGWFARGVRNRFNRKRGVRAFTPLDVQALCDYCRAILV